ncbi:MAG: hypothetical protein DRJ41_01220 [Thermoprotei archaeon]|nr:MAG: hypothetical protein DRJ41_01220 [Thermoprotei archaeon]
MTQSYTDTEKVYWAENQGLIGCQELSRAIKVRYERGVFRPLEKVDFREGEELVVFVRKRRVSEVLDKYAGIFGEADVGELRSLEEKAQAQ